MAQVHVLVTADDPLARAGLAAVLAGQEECVVVGQVPGRELGSSLEVYHPDVVVWDLGWDPAQALELLADMEDAGPPVVVLLAEQELATAAWATGVRGLFPRDVPAEQLAAALAAAAHGTVVVEPSFAASVLPGRSDVENPLAEPLTPREAEVLLLLSEGLPNKTIADRLQVTEHTVKFHVNAIMGKLNAQSRTDAVMRATRLGLIPL